MTRVTDLIDLTAISKIRITVSGTLSGKDAGGTAFQRIYIFTSAATTGYWTSPDVYTALILAHEHVPAYLSASETLDGAQYMLDVSALTGYHRVCIGFAWQYQSNISYIKVSSVEMLTA